MTRDARPRSASSGPARPFRFLMLACGGLLGCGGAAKSPGASAPEAYSARAEPPSSVEEALAHLDAASGEIDRALGARPFAEPPSQPGAPLGAAPAPSEADQPSVQSDSEMPRERTRAAPAAERAADSGPQDTCRTACRALASMTRAADHLCDLAGESDARCERARSRVSGATFRVHDSCLCADR